MGALGGAVAGAAVGFATSQQVNNWARHGEFMSNEQFASHNAKLYRMASALSDGNHTFGLLAGSERSSSVGGGHVGMFADNSAFGKYPSSPSGFMSWVRGKTCAGEFRMESKDFVNNAFSASSATAWSVNDFQHNAIMASSPGTFALTTNCAEGALDAARCIGINVPSNLTTYGIPDPSKVAVWTSSIDAHMAARESQWIW